MINAKKVALSMFVIGLLMFSTANAHSYAATEGGYVVSQSVDDETGIASSGLPTKNNSGLIQPLVSSGTLIYRDAGWYGSSYLVEQATSEGEVTSKRVFQHYLTGSWAKASSYTWSTSNTATWTISLGANIDIANTVKLALGLSGSRTTTYSVAITIPADNTKFSKLGFASDIFNQYYYYQKLVDGTQVASEHSSIHTPTIDSYLIVYYQ